MSDVSEISMDLLLSAHEYFEDMQSEYTRNRTEYTDKQIRDNGIAILAIEKAMPRLPRVNLIFGESGKPIKANGSCFTCGNLVQSDENTFCNKCGQRFDWETAIMLTLQRKVAEDEM